MRAAIAGAGIGGLTAAIALHREGIETTVFERAAELRRIGVGILLAANAVKVLGWLGRSGPVRRIGAPASAGELRSWRGCSGRGSPAAPATAPGVFHLFLSLSRLW